MTGLLSGLFVFNTVENTYLSKWSAYTCLFQICKGSLHTKISDECMHCACVSSQTHSLHKLLGLTKIACHIKSMRLACFRNNIHKMSKPNCGIIRLLLGTSVVSNKGPLFPSLPFFVRHRVVQSLLLRRFGTKSRTKMRHILTANHRGDADIFLKKQMGDDNGAAVATC